MEHPISPDFPKSLIFKFISLILINNIVFSSSSTAYSLSRDSLHHPHFIYCGSFLVICCSNADTHLLLSRQRVR